MQCIKTYAITVHQNQYIKYFLYGAFTKKNGISSVTTVPSVTTVDIT